MNFIFTFSGDADVAAKFALQLIEMGADVNIRSHWTNMNALHYAAYFDVPQLIRVIMKGANAGGKQFHIL